MPRRRIRLVPHVRQHSPMDQVKLLQLGEVGEPLGQLLSRRDVARASSSDMRPEPGPRRQQPDARRLFVRPAGQRRRIGPFVPMITRQRWSPGHAHRRSRTAPGGQREARASFGVHRKTWPPAHSKKLRAALGHRLRVVCRVPARSGSSWEHPEPIRRLRGGHQLGLGQFGGFTAASTASLREFNLATECKPLAGVPPGVRPIQRRSRQPFGNAGRRRSRRPARLRRAASVTAVR